MRDPRPTINSLTVAADAAHRFRDDLRAWGEEYFTDIESTNFREFMGMVPICMRDAGFDATLACMRLYSMDYPVDDALAAIMRKIAASRTSVCTEQVHAWVMRNNVRLPKGTKDGAVVTFNIATAQLSGTIKACVNSEARVIVEMANKAILVAYAEDIVEVRPAPKKAKPPTPTGPNNGGTPIAAREPKVA